MNPPEPEQPQIPPAESPAKEFRTNYWPVAVVFFIPAIITWLTVWGGAGKFAVETGFFWSASAGFINSFLVVRRTQKILWVKIFIFIFLVPFFAVGSLIMSFIGCGIGQSMGGKEVPFP